MRKLALILCFTVMIAIIFSITAPREVTVQGENQIDIPAAEAEETQPDKEEIIRVMNGLLDTLKQDADDSYKLKDYATEQELTEAFEAYLTTELAEQFVDYYFRVEADGVYVFPTETMPWFQEENEYDMINTSNHSVRLVQENENDMVGSYTLVVEMTLQNGWKIQDISYK
ncbi:hypothetical protein MKY30_22830 [Oceanobacillus sp. FSL W8-0428]|uniref:DUF3993 domain-containing protein n=1 Tax=Oceanobacillus sojae TaxID=582851 RepID=A0A511ZML3_9BACI|nr:hypothetical protein [Oceanobacillus sojae]GEN88667.1 hypothetical protein OSO01_34060 [Oceanobacillus sojae]